MKLFSLSPKHIAAAVLLTVTSVVIGCKKEEDTSKTSQECMDENGPGYFSNADGNCQLSNALVVTSSTNHWHTNFYDMQFIRNGSETSGTGKMKYNNGAVSTFSWSMDPHNVSVITCSGYDNVYTTTEQITQVSSIAPNSNNNPTGFSSQYVSGTGTYSVNWSLVAGAL